MIFGLKHRSDNKHILYLINRLFDFLLQSRYPDALSRCVWDVSGMCLGSARVLVAISDIHGEHSGDLSMSTGLPKKAFALGGNEWSPQAILWEDHSFPRGADAFLGRPLVVLSSPECSPCHTYFPAPWVAKILPGNAIL